MYFPVARLSRLAGKALKTASLLPAAALLALGGSVVPAYASSATSPGTLSITQSIATPATASVPTSLTFSVTNTSSVDATSVFMDQNLPNGVKLVSQLPNPDVQCARGGLGGSTVVQCFVATLPAGATETVTISIVAAAAGTIDTSLSASGFVGGSRITNFMNLLTPILPAPTDVQITGFASTGSPALGSLFKYTFQVKNGGSQPAYGTTFADTLPAALTYVGAFTSNFGPGACSLAAGTVTCALGDIPVGGQVLVTLTTIAPSTAQTIVNTASAWSSVTDTNPQSNTTSVTVQAK